VTHRITAITDLIDAALGGDTSPFDDDADNDSCWRCASPAANDSPSGLCDGCRSFLLEDTEIDPAASRARNLWIGADVEALLAPADDRVRDPGPIPDTVEAGFPGYEPVTISTNQWRLTTEGWDPGPVRFTHAGDAGGELVIGYWLTSEGQRLWYTILNQPLVLVGGSELEVNVRQPAFSPPPAADAIVRLFVDPPRRR
jgi:hypothetical protein